MAKHYNALAVSLETMASHDPTLRPHMENLSVGFSSVADAYRDCAVRGISEDVTSAAMFAASANATIKYRLDTLRLKLTAEASLKENEKQLQKLRSKSSEDTQGIRSKIPFVPKVEEKIEKTSEMKTKYEKKVEEATKSLEIVVANFPEEMQRYERWKIRDFKQMWTHELEALMKCSTRASKAFKEREQYVKEMNTEGSLSEWWKVKGDSKKPLPKVPASSCNSDPTDASPPHQ